MAAQALVASPDASLRRRPRAPRWAAPLALAAAFAVGVTAPAVARTLKPGTLAARWPIKTTLPADNEIGHPHSVDIANLMAMQDAPGVTAQDARFRDQRIPGAMGTLHEGDDIRVKAWVHLVAMDNDGDYHIQVSDSPTSAAHCVIVEMPMDQARFVKDATLRVRFQQYRQMLRTKLLHDPTKDFSASGNRMVHPPYMSIEGQLFYDDWHVGGAPRGISKPNHPMHASTLWEIHPITTIAFATAPH